MTIDPAVAEAALDAACAVLGPTVDREAVAAALADADAVYADAERAKVDRMLVETGLAGMSPVAGGVRIRLKHAHDIAAGMVDAFDALIEQRGAENYVEWESTVTDPAGEQAILDGLPMKEWPAHRRYTFIVVKPSGKTPHELRREAEAEVERLRAELATVTAEYDIADRVNEATAPLRQAAHAQPPPHQRM